MDEIGIEELRRLRKDVIEMLYKYGSQKETDNLVDNVEKIVNYIVTGKKTKKPEIV